MDLLEVLLDFGPGMLQQVRLTLQGAETNPRASSEKQVCFFFPPDLLSLPYSRFKDEVFLLKV